MKHINIYLIMYLIALGGIPKLHAQKVLKNDFKTDEHPRVLVNAADKPMLLEKMQRVDWAKQFYDDLKMDVDPIVDIHQKNPGYVISRMQMHWEEGKRYTRFYAKDNYIVRREGNAKYPTIRVTYARPAYGSVPLAPLDKIMPYGDGSLPRLITSGIRASRPISTGTGDATLSNLGVGGEWIQVPFEKTGLGTETFNRNFVQLAWKSSLLYYFTSDKRYAKLAADIIWVFVRGAAQQEQVNPDDIGGDFVPNLVHPYMKGDTVYKGRPISRNGYLSYETMGDTRHFATLPLAYDMIYDYLHNEYFDLPQFKQGIKGEEMWAPAHTESKEWALKQFEIMFKRLIQNKIDRGGGIEGNWNVNEQQSAILYALALDDDETYEDGKGREYYVNALVYGPSTKSHGAYMDLWNGNISPSTGLWPEAPGSYGQNSMGQIIMFGFIYYKNGLDLFPKIPQFRKSLVSSLQLLFPNYRTTAFGDSEYKLLINQPAELVMRYAQEKNDTALTKTALQVMSVSEKRNYVDEFYLPLFYFLDSLPSVKPAIKFDRTFYSKVHSLVMERNMGTSSVNSLAFTLYGFGAKAGHRHPNGMAAELYGRGYIQGADQLRGRDYWGSDAHDYKANVAGHNTVSPNGKGASDDMPQDIEVVYADPLVRDGKAPDIEISPCHNFLDAVNHFYTPEIEAEQRRMLSIVRTSPENGYYVDVFRSMVKDAPDNYHDYIYHNMGIGSEVYDGDGKPIEMSRIPLDSLSGLGYSFFHTQGSLETSHDVQVDFNFGMDNVHMRMFVLGEEGRTVYQLDAEKNFRHHISTLADIRVPTLLVRQKGEAWNHPFVAVYEPYGNGTKGSISKVHTLKTQKQTGVVKFTVEHLCQKREHILYSISSDMVANYQGISLKGNYAVISLDKEKLISVYIAGGDTFTMRGLSISSLSGQPFNAWLEWKEGGLVCTSDQELAISSDYKINTVIKK